jgi:ABC-type branched-subunit amino acid transport system substrate-binding protein
MFIAQAMKSANSVDPSKVNAALHAMTYQGVVGSYAYDKAGNLKQTTVTVYTFKNGALAPLASY